METLIKDMMELHSALQIQKGLCFGYSEFKRNLSVAEDGHLRTVVLLEESFPHSSHST